MAELARVTRPGGRIVVSVMSLFGALRAFFPGVVAAVERFGWERGLVDVLRTGVLDQEMSHGQVMRLYRWRELEALIAGAGCRVVAASAANQLSLNNELFDPDSAWLEVELELCREPGALDGGTHVVAVAERP
jgi:hypothetical protein